MAEEVNAKVTAANLAMLNKIEAENKVRRQKDKEEMKKNLEALASKLSAQIDEKISKAVTAAVSKEVGASLKIHLPAALEAHAKSPAYLEAQKGAFSAVVAPAMEKAVKSSADKVLAGLKPALQESFKASFQASIIPAFEKSCQNMFSQIHGTFERGQAEKAQNEKAQAAAVAALQALQTTADELAPKLQALTTASASAAAAVTASAAAPPGAGGVQALAPAPAQPQETLEQLAARLTSLIHEQKFDEVFSQVLSRSDLNLVTWLCKKVQPRQVFDSKALSAPVILSLVQQLGFDLKNEPQVKIQWLRDAVASLNPQDPLVGTHVPVILRDLQLKLAAMERNPAEFPISQDNDFRILMHVLRSVIG
eukprot:Tamp_08426.p2 GENE.Tamp_08426~~Tamp_08426.p2  ORF type:complete len:366 (+),score=84.34 Tamp_08426:1216-2313(+)